MKTTFETIKKFKPCVDGWTKLLAYYKPGTLTEEVTISEVVKSNGIKDAVWALRCVDDKKTVMLFCADVAESVLHIFTKAYHGDTRVELCIKAIRDYCNGAITLEELKTAANSANYAAYYAAYSAAYYAANSANYAADSANSAYSAYYAANYAADSAIDARNDKWNEILTILNKYICSK